jgi:hypothetical protein
LAAGVAAVDGMVARFGTPWLQELDVDGIRIGRSGGARRYSHSMVLGGLELMS